MLAQVSLGTLIVLLISSGFGVALLVSGLLLWLCLMLGVCFIVLLPLTPEWKGRLMDGFLGGPGFRGGIRSLGLCFCGFWILSVILLIVLGGLGWQECSTVFHDYWLTLGISFFLGLMFGGFISLPCMFPPGRKGSP